MTRVAQWGLAAASLLGAVTGAADTAAGDRLTQRVWLLNGAPGEATLSALRTAGIDGLVLPIGEAVVESRAGRLTMFPLPDLKSLSGWPVTPVVWVSGRGAAEGDAERFASELAPVLRGLPVSATLMLAARAEWAGLVPFAAAVGGRVGLPIEVAVAAAPAARIAASLPSGVRLVVVAFGNPSALGFPASTIADDLAALDEIDATRARYRTVVIVSPRAVPAPGPSGATLASVALPTVADFQPAERGEAFILRQALDWGGTLLAARDTIEIEVVDTARYHRDLGLILRRVRPTLAGWDTAGLPAGEPALGMSLEAFLDYLHGGRSYPTPQVQMEWLTATRVRVTLANPTPQASALASAGNWVEVRFSGTQLLDLGLGEFSGADYGRVDGGVWRRTVTREASAVRLFLSYLPPASRVGGGVVTFLGRPADVSARWVLRLGDGGEVFGPLQSVAVRKP
jgi:hypothetical protein